MGQGRLGAAFARTLYRIATALMVLALSAVAPQALWAQATLENPASGSFQSGISFISGWKCQAGSLTASIDGGGQVPLAYGIPRTDTQSVCGDTNQFYINGQQFDANVVNTTVTFRLRICAK
jgi:hypothetical protein